MSPLAKSVASLSSVTEDWKVAGEMTVMRVSSETAEQKPQVSWQFISACEPEQYVGSSTVIE